MAGLRVVHCLVNSTTRQHGSPPTSDLLGVNYFRTVPADIEFPRRYAPLEVFVRFAAPRRMGGRVRVVVSYLNPDGSDRQIVFQKAYSLPSASSPTGVLFDQSFKLVNIDLPGEGVYVARVVRRVSRGWASRWRVLGRDSFSITRGP